MVLLMFLCSGHYQFPMCLRKTKFFCQIPTYWFNFFSSKMARYCKPFVVSIILGYDIVPRLSVPTLNDLKWRLLSALQDCNVPKYKILSNAARILSLNCLFSSRRNANSIGVDSRLFTANIQYCLLHPRLYSPHPSPTISSTIEAPALLADDDRTLDEVTDGKFAESNSHTLLLTDW